MNDAKIQMLLIEDEPLDVNVVQRFLDLSGKNEFRLTHASSLSEGLATIQQHTFDLVLLDQRLPDSLEGETLPAVRKASPDVPIIVLTGLGDEERGMQCVREGAQDYLVKGRFDAALFIRVIRYTIERCKLLKELTIFQQKEQREKELRRLLDVGQQALPAARTPKLSEASAALFGDFIRRYESILDRSVDNRIYRDLKPGLSENLKALGTELGQAKSTPRDIVEIHSTALRNRLNGMNEQRLQAYVEESRLILPEIMGLVLNHYRNVTLSLT